jgi:hypothetical protein
MTLEKSLEWIAQDELVFRKLARSSPVIRRIEALGERLTLHLDNAKLHAELLVKTEALSVERDLRELFLGSGS